MTNGYTWTMGAALALGSLTIAILSLVGLGYITKIIFATKMEDGKAKVNVNGMNQTRINLARMTIIFLWISVGLSVVANIANMREGRRITQLWE